MKIICRRFHIKTTFAFWGMRTWNMWKACLQTFRNNRIRQKLSYFLRNLQDSRSHDSKILRIKKAKFSGYCFEHKHIGRLSNLLGAPLKKTLQWDHKTSTAFFLCIPTTGTKYKLNHQLHYFLIHVKTYFILLNAIHINYAEQSYLVWSWWFILNSL